MTYREWLSGQGIAIESKRLSVETPLSRQIVNKKKLFPNSIQMKLSTNGGILGLI